MIHVFFLISQVYQRGEKGETGEKGERREGIGKRGEGRGGGREGEDT